MRVLVRALVAWVALAGLIGPGFAVAQTREPPRETRVALRNLPTDLIPDGENKWNCTCDSDGCWPGCFTIATATILKYWAQNGFPNLWNGNENATLIRLRELFPNMLCYGNGNNNGRPGDTVFDAADVAGGFTKFITEKGYNFTVTPVFEPSFDDIRGEIDAGRPVIGVYGESPWGSHAGTIIGYDTRNARKVMIVRPNLPGKPDVDLEWGVGYAGFGLVKVTPGILRGTYQIPPKAAFEVLVDDRDSGYVQYGDWTAEEGLGLGGTSRRHASAEPSITEDTAWAEWTPTLPYDGMWEVMAWMPLSDEQNAFARNTIYKVNHAEGQSMARRSQHDAIQGWMSLGVFPFSAGSSGSVRLGTATGDAIRSQIWADAVRFVWRGSLVVRHEEDPSRVYWVRDGRRRLIPPDASTAAAPRTFEALRLVSSDVRKLTSLQLSQYPEGDALPSIYGGWLGQYFNNAMLAPPASLVRVDGSLDFAWPDGAPAPNMSRLGFSARWTRVLAMPEGRVPVSVNAIGGVRLWVDGKLEIDAWNAADQAEGVLVSHQRVISVTGDLHVVEVEYRSAEGVAPRVSFGNLPPFAPIVAAPITPTMWTTAATAALSWLDAGDPDSPGAERRFFATVWRDGSQDSLTSGWMRDAQWDVSLPSEGRYYWRVSAGDDASVSEWSSTRQIWVDRSPPWAQMQSAEAQINVAPGTAVGQADRRTALKSQGIRLTWWSTDTMSGVAGHDVQYREVIRAETTFSPTVVMREVAGRAQEVVIEGGRELTRATIITEIVPTLVYEPVLSFVPLTETVWITFAAGLPTTSTTFIGTPGSLYEFRVRAVDHAGHAQAWYDGYSVQAQMDINSDFERRFMPIVSR